jgi:nitrate reductase molybdenum cofactor assembly chaperone NarJ/NarW
MINASQTESLRLLSALLHYPDDDLLGDLASIETAAARIATGTMRQAIDGFIRYLADHPPMHLRECYTAAFDLSPSTTLNLTWHQHGDSEKRAAALARLQRTYVAAGWERTTGELPDYLPLMLEFLSVCPQPEKADAIWQCLQGIQGFVERLGQTAPAYADLLRPLIATAVKR